MEISTSFLNYSRELNQQALELVSSNEFKSFTDAVNNILEQEKTEQVAAKPETISRFVADLEQLPGILPVVPKPLEAMFEMNGRITTKSTGESPHSSVNVICIYFKGSAIDREFVISDGEADEQGIKYEIVLLMPSKGKGNASGIVEEFVTTDSGERELAGQRWLTEKDISKIAEKITQVSLSSGFSAGAFDNS